MYLNPIHPDAPWDSLNPDTTVYTPYGSDSLFPELGEMFADCCFTSKGEGLKHHWMTSKTTDCELVEETLRDFLKRRLHESEMNPFCSLSKIQMMDANRRLWED